MFIKYTANEYNSLDQGFPNLFSIWAITINFKTRGATKLKRGLAYKAHTQSSGEGVYPKAYINVRVNRGEGVKVESTYII
jgi:hypothetical protein